MYMCRYAKRIKNIYSCEYLEEAKALNKNRLDILKPVMPNCPEGVRRDLDGSGICCQWQYGVNHHSCFPEWKTKKQVEFIEAFRALREDCKDIYCEYEKQTHYFSEDFEGDHEFNEDLIADGEWYID